MEKVIEVKIAWNPERQAVHVDFDPKELKTFEFLMALCDMAKEQLRFRLEMARMQQMQQAAREASAVNRLLKG